MIKFLGKAFTTLISFISFLLLILGPVCGFIAAKNFIPKAGSIISDPSVIMIVFPILGLVAAFIVDVVVFGLLAQILAIRKDVEAIKEKING